MRSATSLLIALAACAPAEPVDDPAIVPPVFGADTLEPWLAAGHYLSWSCDPAPHPAPGNSPHGFARQCENPIAFAAEGSAAWPVDASWVMELSDGSGALVGRAVQRLSEPTNDGASWYWYETASGVLQADGWGFEGPARDVCSACHALSDHRFVY